MTNQIYIACLSSYNAGTLHGEWIAATTDADEMQEHVDRILRASPEPNLVRYVYKTADGETFETQQHPLADSWHGPKGLPCSPSGKLARFIVEKYTTAEEFAIHDFESDAGELDGLGEYDGLQTVAVF